MRTLITICVLLFAVCGYTQSKNEVFEKSKGTLTPGINHGKKVEYPADMDPAIRPKTLTYMVSTPDSIRAIFEGQVTDVMVVPNHEESYVVQISYGDYSISYAGLGKPVVVKGSAVKRDQFIGTLARMSYTPYYFYIVQMHKGETELNTDEWFRK